MGKNKRGSFCFIPLTSWGWGLHRFYTTYYLPFFPFSDASTKEDLWLTCDCGFQEEYVARVAIQYPAIPPAFTPHRGRVIVSADKDHLLTTFSLGLGLSLLSSLGSMLI